MPSSRRLPRPRRIGRPRVGRVRLRRPRCGCGRSRRPCGRLPRSCRTARGGVDHDAGESFIDALLAQLEGVAVVQVHGDGDGGDADGGVDEFAEVDRVGVAAGALGDLEDDGGFFLLAGLDDGLHSSMLFTLNAPRAYLPWRAFAKSSWVGVSGIMSGRFQRCLRTASVADPRSDRLKWKEILPVRLRTTGPWDHGTMGPRDYGTMGPWDWGISGGELTRGARCGTSRSSNNNRTPILQ